MLISDGYGRGTTYQLNIGSGRETLHADNETLHADNETLHADNETLHGHESIPKRMLRDEIIQKILAFCSEWRTAEEIATFLHRNKRYITNEILPKMEDTLERLYPQVRRHPDQKYRRKTK